MSELITNLQAIYNTKLALKEAIGTTSDDFVQYPSYISGMVTPTGTYNISNNGNFDVSTYANAYVNVPTGGETIAQKNVAWQTKWAPALAQVAAGLYAQDPSYGEPMITDPSGWCIQTALDGNAAMSEMVALDCLWIEIYTDNNAISLLHDQYIQIFQQMGLELYYNDIFDKLYLVSTDDDKILPFDADEAIVTNITGILGYGLFGGKKISSFNGNVENAKWDYYGVVFNGSGFEYKYCGQYDYVVTQMPMLEKMHDDGVTFINNIPVVNLATLQGYITDFQMDGTVNPSGSLSITSNNTYDVSSYASVNVNVPSSSGFPYDVTQSFYQLNGLTLKYMGEDSGDIWLTSLQPNESKSIVPLYYAGNNTFYGIATELNNDIDDSNVENEGNSNEHLSTTTSNFGSFVINNTSSKIVNIHIFCHWRSESSEMDLTITWTSEEPKE